MYDKFVFNSWNRRILARTTMNQNQKLDVAVHRTTDSTLTSHFQVIRQISFVLSPTWDFRLPHYLRLTNFAENALRANARNVCFFPFHSMKSQIYSSLTFA